MRTLCMVATLMMLAGCTPFLLQHDTVSGDDSMVIVKSGLVRNPDSTASNHCESYGKTAELDKVTEYSDGVSYYHDNCI